MNQQLKTAMFRPVQDGSFEDTSAETGERTTGLVSKIHPDKALAFWKRQREARLQDGNCGRCGRENDNGGKTCDKCLAYSAKYRRLKKIKPVTVDGARLDLFEHRIACLENNLARLQVAGNLIYKKAYRTGFRKGADIQRKVFNSIDRDDLESMSKQEYYETH